MRSSAVLQRFHFGIGSFQSSRLLGSHKVLRSRLPLRTMAAVVDGGVASKDAAGGAKSKPVSREVQLNGAGGITPQVSARLSKFGTTVFTEISALAAKHSAVNLGQGFPNFDGPNFIKEAAIQAIHDGKGQYARMSGVPELNRAVAAQFAAETGVTVDPDREVTVTSGCTEAIAATILGLINPGDEVILFQPFYDSYLATLAMADAVVRTVTLRPPEFAVPEAELQATFSPKTRAVLVNSPHNPTGKVFSPRELELVASLCKEHDAIAVSDEVYSKMVYQDQRHVSIASLPGMYERTITLNSLGKTFSLTGWKVGWAVAPAHLTWGLRQAHSYLTFAVPTPLQWGAVAALAAPEAFYQELHEDYSRRKNILVDGLKEVGFRVYEPQGTYFVMADHTMFGFANDVDFCKHLIEEVGVAAIPPSAFYVDAAEGKDLVRFAFCKDDETLKEAVRRMKAKLKPSLVK
eukprot:jgi/Mesen1/7228/ME000372S06471